MVARSGLPITASCPRTKPSIGLLTHFLPEKFTNASDALTAEIRATRAAFGLPR